MMWHSAYWGVPVAEKLGLLRSFLKGEREAFVGVAANIETVAGLIEREREANARTLSDELAKFF